MEECLPSTSKVVDTVLENSLQNGGTVEKGNNSDKPLNMSDGVIKLRSWLNKSLRIEMSDGRILFGTFLCTDRDANIILGSCSEYLPEDIQKQCENCDGACYINVNEEARMLGLVMVPGKHIVSVSIDETENRNPEEILGEPLNHEIISTDVI